MFYPFKALLSCFYCVFKCQIKTVIKHECNISSLANKQRANMSLKHSCARGKKCWCFPSTAVGFTIWLLSYMFYIFHWYLYWTHFLLALMKQQQSLYRFRSPRSPVTFVRLENDVILEPLQPLDREPVIAGPRDRGYIVITNGEKTKP